MAVKPHPTIEGAWRIDYWPEGNKGKRKYETYIGTFEDATRRWTELVRQHCSLTKDKVNPRLNDALADYLEWLDLHRSKSYYKSMAWALEKIRPHFGQYPPSQITEQLITDFKKKYRDTPSHCNQCLDYLKIIINWMADRGMANRLPFKVEKLKVFKSLPQPPSPTEFDAFMQSVEANFLESGVSLEERAKKKAVLLVMYETGMRWVEARHLRWEHLNMTDGRLYLGRTKTGVGRFTIVTDEIISLLRPYKKPEGYIFTNPKTDEPYSTIRKLIQGNAKAVGIAMKGTHGLRHAMGTDNMEATGDLRGTMEILGHSEIRSSVRYSHVAIEHKRRLLERTREYRKGKLGKAKKPTGVVSMAATNETEKAE